MHVIFFILSLCYLLRIYCLVLIRFFDWAVNMAVVDFVYSKSSFSYLALN